MCSCLLEMTVDETRAPIMRGPPEARGKILFVAFAPASLLVPAKPSRCRTRPRRQRLPPRSPIKRGTIPSKVQTEYTETIHSNGHPKRALVLFGMQQDFFSDLQIRGQKQNMPSNGTDDVLPVISESAQRPGKLRLREAKYIAKQVSMLLQLSFDATIWCKTCHPVHHCSFFENNPGSTIGTFELIRRVTRRNGGRRPQACAALPC